MLSAEHEVTIYEAASHPIEPPRMERVALGELAGSSVSDLSTLYVPPSGPSSVETRMLIRLGVNPVAQQGAAIAPTRIQ